MLTNFGIGTLGMVRAMKQKPAVAKAAPVPLPRTVTLLGATGSIGTSTADLLRREPGRYAVEAVTANRDAAALARLARELGARFAAVADPAAYSELKTELAGSGIEAAAGPAAMVEAARRPANWVMAAITRAGSLAPALDAAERRATGALAPEELDVLVHPQSIVHGLVEFRDGSVIAQLGSPDMRIPISHCLAWPVRMGTPAARLNLAQIASLSFEEPDLTRFPALAIARRALAAGGAAPTVLNAANEVAVHEFVSGRLVFCGIPALVEATLDAAERRGETGEPASVEQALHIDHTARRLAADLLPEIAAMAC